MALYRNGLQFSTSSRGMASICWRSTPPQEIVTLRTSERTYPYISQLWNGFIQKWIAILYIKQRHGFYLLKEYPSPGDSHIKDIRENLPLYQPTLVWLYTEMDCNSLHQAEAWLLFAGGVPLLQGGSHIKVIRDNLPLYQPALVWLYTEMDCIVLHQVEAWLLFAGGRLSYAWILLMQK